MMSSAAPTPSIPRVKAMVSHAVAVGTGAVPKSRALTARVKKQARIAGDEIRPPWWGARLYAGGPPGLPHG